MEGEDHVVMKMVAMLGKLPDPWWDEFEKRHIWFDEDGNPKALGTARKTTIKQTLAGVGEQDLQRPPKVIGANEILR